MFCFFLIVDLIVVKLLLSKMSEDVFFVMFVLVMFIVMFMFVVLIVGVLFMLLFVIVIM